MTTLRLNDNDTVSWRNGKSVNVCKVKILRAMLRHTYPEQTDEEIELEIASRLVPHGEA